MSSPFMLLPMPHQGPSRDDDDELLKVKAALQLLQHLTVKAHPWPVPVGAEVHEGLPLSPNEAGAQDAALDYLRRYLRDDGGNVHDCPKCARDGYSPDCSYCQGCQRISIRPAPGR